MNGKPKKPGRKYDPPPEQKAPRGGAHLPNYDAALFRWRTGMIDCGGPFGWAAVDHQALFGLIIPALHSREEISWHDLIRAGCHDCEVTGMEKPARDRLVELDIDVDTLFSLRISGKERIWGVRDRTILNLLWWDPEHGVYVSKKKNT